MKVQLSKRQAALARNLAAVAHERELRQLLEPLATAFAQWHAKQLDTCNLLNALDRFAVPRRRLSQRYETSSIAPQMVAYALAAGLLREDEVPDDLSTALEQAVAFYRQGLADGSVSMQEED